MAPFADQSINDAVPPEEGARPSDDVKQTMAYRLGFMESRVSSLRTALDRIFAVDDDEDSQRCVNIAGLALTIDDEVAKTLPPRTEPWDDA